MLLLLTDDAISAASTSANCSSRRWVSASFLLLICLCSSTTRRHTFCRGALSCLLRVVFECLRNDPKERERKLLFAQKKSAAYHFLSPLLAFTIHRHSIRNSASILLHRHSIRAIHVRSTFLGCQYLHQWTNPLFVFEDSGIFEKCRQIGKILSFLEGLCFQFILILIDCYSSRLL